MKMFLLLQEEDSLGEDSSRGDVADITSLKVTILPDCEDKSAPNSTNNSSHGIDGIHGTNPRSVSSDSNRNSNSNSKQEGSQSTSLPLALALLELPAAAMVPPGRIIHIYKKNGMYFVSYVLSHRLLSSVPQLGLLYNVSVSLSALTHFYLSLNLAGLFASSEITHEHPTLRRLVPYVELGVDDHLLIAYRKGLRAVIQSRETPTPTTSSQNTSPSYCPSASPVTGAEGTEDQGQDQGQGQGQGVREGQGQESMTSVKSTGLTGYTGFEELKKTERKLPAPWQVSKLTFPCLQLLYSTLLPYVLSYDVLLSSSIWKGRGKGGE